VAKIINKKSGRPHMRGLYSILNMVSDCATSQARIIFLSPNAEGKTEIKSI